MNDDYITFFKNWVDKEVNRCKQFTELKLQSPTLKKLEPELKQILSFRMSAQLIYFIKIHIIMCLNITYDEKGNPVKHQGINTFWSSVNPGDIAEQIADDQAKIFLREIEKNNIRDILHKAKIGDRRAIYKLVLWNKTAISLNFVVEKIAEAALNEDQTFFDQIAGALKKNVSDKRKKKNKILIEILRYYIPFIKAKWGLSERQIWKELTNSEKTNDLFNSFVASGNEDVPALVDIDYFSKLLKRHRVIP